MAEILPFRAFQYSPDRVPLDRVVTQPYDKISPEMERRYVDAHPNNVVRLIRPASNPPPDNTVSVYGHAARTLDRWCGDGIIRPVSEPCLFAYFQRFRTPGSDEVRTRKGFICLTRLEDYANRMVFPHERTLTGPKRDRLELLRSTRTHFGQVFLLYSDPENKVDAVLDGLASKPPELSIRDEYGVDHRVWSVSESKAIGAIRLEMADKKLVIADGHHRYETALAFRDEKRTELGSDEASAYEWLMTTLVNMESPGMTILPTHRVLSNLEGFDRAALIRSLGDYFDIQEVEGEHASEASLAGSGAERPSIGIATRDSDGLFMCRLRDAVNPADLLNDMSPARAQLDVVILHRLILGKALGISEEQVRSGNYLTYVRGFAEAIDEVRSGRGHAAFLLNATRLDQVRDIAFGGEVLPQKSTDFFPKLLSGLAMHIMG